MHTGIISFCSGQITKFRDFMNSITWEKQNYNLLLSGYIKKVTLSLWMPYWHMGEAEVQLCPLSSK
jgi:hypothetical protein